MTAADDEIEELWSLADECREWMAQAANYNTPHDSSMAVQFERIAKRLDDIAKRLAERLPT